MHQRRCIGRVGKILAALTVFFPVDEEARRYTASPTSLKTLVSVLSHGDLAAWASAAIVLHKLASSPDWHTVDVISRTPGVCSALVGLVRKPMSPQANKAALITAYYLVFGSNRAAASFAELGQCSSLWSSSWMLTRGRARRHWPCWTASCADTGLESVRAHTLVVPCWSRRCCVSALWRLCCAADTGAGACCDEALRVGTFKKLLQVGCGGVTKDRANELLNGFRGSVECIETVDFRGLKRPF